MLAERLAPQPALLPAGARSARPRDCCWRRSSAARAASAGIADCSWCTRDSRRPAASSIAWRVTWVASTATTRRRGAVHATRHRVVRRVRAACCEPGATPARLTTWATSLSAVDVYSATFMALFKPLPPEQCDMHPGVRAAFEWLDAPTAAGAGSAAARAPRHDVREASAAAAVALTRDRRFGHSHCPQHALLARYVGNGGYADCFVADVPRPAFHMPTT